jgi:hypothetical protein
MRTVIDTNVIVFTNGKSPQASLSCVTSCIEQLRRLVQQGRIILDDSWLILREYQHNLNQAGQPGFGDAFLRWALENRTNPNACEIYPLEKDVQGDARFAAFPQDARLAGFDPADEKFAALAAVSNAPVWNAVDLGWWEYREALEHHDIRVEFLCPDFLQGKQ